jgi:asparagine synthase (glutamine-hydrolysing)
MSGIIVVASLDGAPVEPSTVAAMAAAAPYRSPGGSAGWSGDGIAVASMLPATVPSDRPPAGPVERHGLLVVADARLDDREALATELLARGYLVGDPVATSDGELILAAHRCWGDAAPSRLTGDLAYVLWDSLRRRLVAVRDPMGMRPLYQRIEEGRRALFASEIQQLLAAPDVPARIDERGIVATLAGPYLSADATVYAGIDQVAPGGLIVVDASGMRSRRWWTPDPAKGGPPADEAVVGSYRETLARAVEDRLRGTGTAGLLLSGGLDSGSIAATAGRLRAEGRLGTTLRTYTWSLPTLPEADERGTALRIAAAHDLPNAAVEADDAWPLAGFPLDGPDRDDPFIWPYQRAHAASASRAASEGATVMLSGTRGDELVGDWVFDELGLIKRGRLRAAVRGLRRAPASRRWPAASVLRRGVVGPWLWEAGLAAGPLRRLASPDPSPLWPPWIPDDVARRVDLGDVIRGATRLPRFDGHARSQRLQRLASAQGARVAVLGERTMAKAGIGYADPFADRRLVELVLALPQWQVQDRDRPKHLAREAMRGIMPEAARAAVAKTIPTSLFDRGLRDRSIDTARDLLGRSLAAEHGWLDAAGATRSYEHYVRTGHARFDFWWPLAVEWWLRRWWS